MTTSDVVGRFRQILIKTQKGPFSNYLPYTPQTEPILERLAALKPGVLATMHGATYVGDGERAIRDLGIAMRQVLGPL